MAPVYSHTHGKQKGIGCQYFPLPRYQGNLFCIKPHCPINAILEKECGDNYNCYSFMGIKILALTFFSVFPCRFPEVSYFSSLGFCPSLISEYLLKFIKVKFETIQSCCLRFFQFTPSSTPYKLMLSYAKAAQNFSYTCFPTQNLFCWGFFLPKERNPVELHVQPLQHCLQPH